MTVWLLCALAHAVPTRIGTGPAVADGVTPVEVRLWLDKGAKKPKVTAETGSVTSVETPGDGTAVVIFLPEVRTAAGTAILLVTSDKVTTRVEVPLLPPGGGRLDVTLDPPLVSSGGSATLTVRPPAGADGPLAVAVSSGTVEPLVRQSDGSFTAKYTAARSADPRAVVFAASAVGAPEVWGTTVGRVRARKTVALDAPSGTRCTLKVGDATTPEVATKAGKVSFDLELDPAFSTATLALVRADGTREEREVLLPAAAGAVAFLPGPETVIAGRPVTLRVVAASASGAPAEPRVSAGALTVRGVVADGASWRVELGGVVPGPVVVTAELGASSVEERLTAVDVGVWTVSAEPTPFPAKGRVSATLTARGPAAPAWSWVEGSGAAGRAAGGGWASSATLAEKADVLRVDVGPKVTPSGLPAAAIAGTSAWPVVRTEAAAQLRVAVVDAAGLPVAGQSVAFALASGEAQLSAPTATTDALGIARATLTAGKAEGPLTVRADAGGVWTEVTVLAAGAAGGPDVTPEPTGPAAAWLASVTAAAFWREGRAPEQPPVAVPSAVVAETPGEKPARVPREGGGDGRAALALLASDSLGAATFDGEGESFPADAQYATALPGSLALTAAADVRVVGAWSAVAVATGRLERWAVKRDLGFTPQLDVRAGGRWRPTGDLDLGLTVARVSGLAVRYTPSGAQEGFTVARGGLRPEIGYAFPVGDLDLRAALGVALGPVPLEETAELTVDLGDEGGIRLRLGLALEHRGWTVVRGALSGALSQTRVVLAFGGVLGG